MGLVKLVQQDFFAEDLRSIRTTTGQVKTSSKLKALSPVLIDGVLGSRGRLSNAGLSIAQKQQQASVHSTGCAILSPKSATRTPAHASHRYHSFDILASPTTKPRVQGNA